MKTGTRMPIATLFMISARLSRRVERWPGLHHGTEGCWAARRSTCQGTHTVTLSIALAEQKNLDVRGACGDPFLRGRSSRRTQLICVVASGWDGTWLERGGAGGDYSVMIRMPSLLIGAAYAPVHAFVKTHCMCA